MKHAIIIGYDSAKQQFVVESPQGKQFTVAATDGNALKYGGSGTGYIYQAIRYGNPTQKLLLLLGEIMETLGAEKISAICDSIKSLQTERQQLIAQIALFQKQANTVVNNPEPAPVLASEAEAQSDPSLFAEVAKLKFQVAALGIQVNQALAASQDVQNQLRAFQSQDKAVEVPTPSESSIEPLEAITVAPGAYYELYRDFNPTGQRFASYDEAQEALRPLQNEYHSHIWVVKVDQNGSTQIINRRCQPMASTKLALANVQMAYDNNPGCKATFCFTKDGRPISEVYTDYATASDALHRVYSAVFSGCFTLVMNINNAKIEITRFCLCGGGADCSKSAEAIYSAEGELITPAAWDKPDLLQLCKEENDRLRAADLAQRLERKGKAPRKSGSGRPMTSFSSYSTPQERKAAKAEQDKQETDKESVPSVPSVPSGRLFSLTFNGVRYYLSKKTGRATPKWFISFWDKTTRQMKEKHVGSFANLPQEVQTELNRLHPGLNWADTHKM